MRRELNCWNWFHSKLNISARRRIFNRKSLPGMEEVGLGLDIYRSARTRIETQRNEQKIRFRYRILHQH